MIMFPAHLHNLSEKNSFGAYGEGGGYYDCFISLGGGSNLMAEDGSRSEISISKDDINQEINKDVNDGGWLRLSLGSGPEPSRRPQISLGSRTVELDLLPGGGGSGRSSSGGDETWSLTLTAPPPQQQQQQQQHQHQQQLSFQVKDFRGPIAITSQPPPTFYLQTGRGVAAAIDSMPAVTFTHNQQYDNSYLPFRPYPLTTLSSPSSFSASLHQLPASGPPPLRIGFRVVDPPPRPHSGVWFSLQASQTQTKEPYLPQVPKRYLRIKFDEMVLSHRDGRTTVGLLIKYLVYKLKLDGEFEII
ncbi:hypothetical protein L1987_11865 [Smallanthus sonchifolius]|uniref:Uncharacterized protein n=1 Tax=Smallanthus sonchifolius TaxID=185202 RepID=A0ACB9JC68_9ASTR|nr:hypothetical protein L1987_11865 [Smallanthus sonchifolius]